MEFKIKYEITPMYLPLHTKRRSGQKIDKVKFVVAHDTGNPNSSALQNVKYFQNSANEMSASAHIFVDDKVVLEAIPAISSNAEKAWHVLYNKTKDNQLFDCESNDAAIGVELCYGSNINAEEAYKRYVWIIAFICWKFKLDPSKCVVGHMILDPERKTDPQNALGKMGKSYQQLLKDVVKEYNDCLIINKEVVKLMLESWQKELGEKALTDLHTEGLINNIEEWKNKLEQPVPNWLFLTLMQRLYEKVK